MKTQEEIVRFVVGHFLTHPRSMGEDGTCYYNHPEGGHCAFGMMLDEKFLKRLSKDLGELNTATAGSLISQYGREIIKEEFRGHSVFFYRQVQRLHDSPPNWGEESSRSETRTLSDEGKRYIKKTFGFEI